MAILSTYEVPFDDRIGYAWPNGGGGRTEFVPGDSGGLSSPAGQDSANIESVTFWLATYVDGEYTVRCTFKDPDGNPTDAAETVFSTSGLWNDRITFSFSTPVLARLLGGKFEVNINLVSGPPSGGARSPYLALYEDSTSPYYLDHTLVGEWYAGSHSKATNPTPADEATEVDWSTPALSWSGTGDTYTVYVATSTPFVSSELVAEDIAATTYTLSTEQKAEFADSDGVLYWRVDSTKDGSTLTGDTWSFDPRPGQASGPTPATAGTDIGLSQQLAWTPGTNAAEVTVKITHPFTFEVTDLVSGELVSFYDWDSDYLTWSNSYSWRVDSKNFYGTTEGTAWSFGTPTLAYLRTTYNTIGGGSGPYDGGVEGVDFWWTGLNNVCTIKRLVLLAKDRFYYEELS